MKKRKVLISCICLTFFLIFVGIAIAFLFRKSYSNNDLKVTWEYSGKPLVVGGEVYDKNKLPISNMEIEISTSSGDDTIFTDKHGKFSIKLGEPEITEFRIGSNEIINSYILGIPTDKGVYFNIEIINRHSSSLKFKK